jgi:hypothetical protein
MNRNLKALAPLPWRGLLCILYSWQAEMLAFWRKISVGDPFDLCVNLEILGVLKCRIFIRTSDVKSRIGGKHIKPPICKVLADKLRDILLGFSLTPCS